MEEKLIKYLNEHYGYISSKEFEQIGISKTLIPNFIKKCTIRKVAYGIYIDNNLIDDEYYILQKRLSNIVFSYNTACYLLELSDRSPYKLEITTIRTKHINEDLDTHYVTKDKFEIGMSEIMSPYGNPIKIYIVEVEKNQNYDNILKEIEKFDGVKEIKIPTNAKDVLNAVFN